MVGSRRGSSTTRRSPSRQAFGRRAPSVLRAAWQAGQLPGGGVAVDCEPERQPAGGLSAVSVVKGLGRGWYASKKKAGVPLDISFKTKPEIALEQIQWACEAGLPRGVGLMDAAYGNDSRLRSGMTALGLIYVAGIQSNTLVWPSGTGPRRRGKPLNNTGHRDEPDLDLGRRGGAWSVQNVPGARSGGGKARPIG